MQTPNDKAAAATEYALLGGLVVLVIVTSVAFFGGRTSALWNNLANRISNVWIW